MEDKIIGGSTEDTKYLILDIDTLEGDWLKPYEGDMLFALLNKLMDIARERGYKGATFKPLEVIKTNDIPEAESLTDW